jgi:hypothetical protein
LHNVLEILTTADANVVREASVRVGLPTNRIGDAGIVFDPELSWQLRDALSAFARTIVHRGAKARE